MRPAPIRHTRRHLFELLGCIPAVLWSRAVTAQTPGAAPTSQAAAAASQPAQPGRVFASDAGLILNTIKPDRAADFESVIQRLKDALNQSSDPQRKQQAQGWRVFKALEPGANNSALYVFWLNPAVKDADYTVSKILSEAFPNEVADLYRKFSESYAGGQTIVNLKLVNNLGQVV